MSRTGTQDVETELIESVCERVRERVAPEEVAEAEAFVRAYYRGAPAEDLRGRAPVDLYGAALSHWSFARGREPHETLVRVYNPTYEQHGWQSPHTAIDIVSDDMPFIVDSVSMELSRREAGIHVLVHPVIGDESYMHVEIDRRPDGLEDLADALRRVLAQVRAAVEDWQPMRERMRALLTEPDPTGVDPAEIEEARALLAWLSEHHFTFLGYREYALEGDQLRAVEGTGLGPPARRRRRRVDGVRQAPAGGSRVRTRTASAGADQGQRALPRAPSELPGLRRRQALRRHRERRRRAALPRPLHHGRLSRGTGRNPGAATDGARGARARRLRARQPRPQGAGRDHRHLPARRAVPDVRGRALRRRARDPRPR